MTEREVIRLLASHHGTPLCVSYRVRPGGQLRLREPSRPAAVLALGLALAGCAGQLEAPESAVAVEGCPIPEHDDGAVAVAGPREPAAAEGGTASPYADPRAPQLVEPEPEMGTVMEVDPELEARVAAERERMSRAERRRARAARRPHG